MTSDELGRLSGWDLAKPHDCDDNGLPGPITCPWCEEEAERQDAHDYGRAGETAIVSRAQVRAALGPLLVDERPRNPENYGQYVSERAFNRGVHAAARAILGLPPDAPSPLEDSADD